MYAALHWDGKMMKDITDKLQEYEAVLVSYVLCCQIPRLDMPQYSLCLSLSCASWLTILIHKLAHTQNFPPF